MTQNWLASLFGSVTLGFGTLLWPYSKFGFKAPLAALCLLAATYAAWVGTQLARPRMMALAGRLLGAGWLIRHEFLLAVIPVVLWLVFESRGDRRTLTCWLRRVAPGILAGGVIWATYNWVRFGNVLDVGHTPGYGVPGFYGLVLSPGGSVFLCSPVLLAGVVAFIRLWHSDRHLASLLTGQVGVLFCYYASLDDWIGGRSYGPRYLVSILPLVSVVLAWWFHRCSTRERKLLTGLALASVLVQVPGVLVDYSKPNPDDGRTETLTHYERQYSWPAAYLVTNLHATWTAVPRNARYLLGAQRAPSVASLLQARDQPILEQLAFSLDLWWLYLFHLGLLSGLVAVGLGLAPLGVALLLTRRFRPEVHE